jgi:hypothetical protein
LEKFVLVLHKKTQRTITIRKNCLAITQEDTNNNSNWKKNSWYYTRRHNYQLQFQLDKFVFQIFPQLSPNNKKNVYELNNKKKRKKTYPLLFFHADVELVQVFEIDEVEECPWHIKMPSRNAHMFLLVRDEHPTSRISSHKSVCALLMKQL